MYQYYNSEKKDEVFAALKKNVKITKENIPAATQLFTPDWIVRYMVENSLGRLWLEGHPNEELKSKKLRGAWKYYLEEAKQEPEVEAELIKIRAEYAQLTPENIRCIDPCQGSGHILAYMFDVLMQIYESYGYTTQEAVASIVKNNIYGLDIDERAAQLSYFAVMMKACQYDKRFLKRKDEDGNPKVPQPRVYAIQESNDVDSHVLEYFCNGDAGLKEAMETIMEEMYDAKEYGSIITVTEQNWDVIYARFEEIREDISIYKESAFELLSLVQVAHALSQKYHVVVTNPPYMGSSNMNLKLNEYIKQNYSNYKSDSFSAFVIRCSLLAEKDAYLGFFTPYVWMFIQSYEKLRKFICNNKTIETLIQFEYSAFEEATVPVCTFTFRNSHVNKKGCYIRLTDFRGGMEVQRQKTLEAISNHVCGYYYEQNTNNFSQISGSPMAYWISDFSFFKFTPFSDIFISGGRVKTHDNNLYTRNWWEVKKGSARWIPYANGGDFRKWYGNHIDLVDWSINARKFYETHGGMCQEKFWFREGLTWGAITSGNNSYRIKPKEFMFSSAAPTIFNEKFKCDLSALAFLNSKVAEYISKVINPTLNQNVNDTLRLPYCGSQQNTIEIVSDCLEHSIKDWDSFETSWDFERHPIVQVYFDNIHYQQEGLLKGRNPHLLRDCYIQWGTDCNLRFETLKRNEEELNRIFIDIYGLQDELTPEVEDKDVTVRKADLQRDIKSLISYAVGCMFGRYSLDKEGLIFAGGRMEDKFSYYGGTFADAQDYHFDGKYTLGELGSKFYYIPVEGKKALECWKVDADNIIPITDDEYFEDDIVEKFVEFIRTVYGEESLDTNLKFIADVLGGKGQPREVIRNYFLNDFYKDHCKIYQKRPIYWLFDSGKKNGFKCLIYMHRYQPDTIARIRTDYVHEQQSRYRTAIADLEHRIANAGTGERVKLNKSLKKIQEQADELHTYEEKIHHLADQMIAIDLDDGVKHNYEIFKDVLAKIK